MEGRLVGLHIDCHRPFLVHLYHALPCLSLFPQTRSLVRVDCDSHRNAHSSVLHLDSQLLIVHFQTIFVKCRFVLIPFERFSKLFLPGFLSLETIH